MEITHVYAGRKAHSRNEGRKEWKDKIPDTKWRRTRRKYEQKMGNTTGTQRKEGKRYSQKNQKNPNNTPERQKWKGSWRKSIKIK